MSEGRWSAAVPASVAFTDEQSQRAQALRVAREVCEERGSAKGPFTASSMTVSAADLLDVAEWIVSGGETLDVPHE